MGTIGNPKKKKSFQRKKEVQYPFGLSIERVGGSCQMLKCCLLDTRRGQDADKLFVVSKMVIIVPSHASPNWPLWKTWHSTPRHREAFLAEERITSVEMRTSGCQMCGKVENLNIFMQNM